MIRFSCKCGAEFNFTDDLAGTMTQCPRCRLLVDVPTTEELVWMAPDGALAVDPRSEDAPPARTLAELYKAFARRKSDDDGHRSHDDFAADVDDPPNVETHRPERITPRYDPETGERIIPLALRDETPQPVIPLASEVGPRQPPRLPTRQVHIAVAVPVTPIHVLPVPVEPIPVEAIPVEAIPVEPLPAIPARPVPVRRLGYANADTGRPTTLSTLAVDLLVRPANLFVLFFVSWFYVLGFLFKLPLTGLALFLGFPPILAQLINFPLWALVSHYGCVVEDIGPDAIDELPRPLRNFSVGDDLFAPGLRVSLAAAICYGPAFALGAATGLGTPLVVALTLSLAAVGSYLFPAVVLTLLTGSTVLNLAPARVVGVIRDCGGQYAGSALLAGAVLIGHVGFVLGPAVLPTLGRFGFLRAGDHVAVLVPALCLTMYLTHLFAWHLGLMYRAHHDVFPWLAQRHIPTNRRPRQTLSA
jgi:hypothetical protein